MLKKHDKLQEPVALSPKEAFDCLQDGAAIVDIRPEYETSYRVFDVEHVYVLPYRYYKEKFQEIPKEKPLAIADSVGLTCSEDELKGGCACKLRPKNC